ncbi:MAG TPA: RecX family transcriptional regulator [Rubrobacteraceae bacterium]|nr:RecX family transcriptional regulator [Rubrobacteraceae bacterium]
MPEITSLRERRGRARIWVDGEFWAEIDADVAVERGLREGVALRLEELEEVRVAGERALAMNRALHFLGYRARSRGEVRERLRRYGYAEESVEGVIGRLEELGYLDDEEFARAAAREKARRYGPRRVLGELRRSGVDAELAQGVVDDEFAQRSELEEARSLAARRYNREGSDAEARRVYGFLMRRGYSAEVCAEVAREYRGARGAD